MQTEGLWILFSFIIAFVVAFATTPLVKNLAFKIGAVDVPKDERRIHKVPIARLGGLAIFYGFIVSVLCFGKLGWDPTGTATKGMLLGGVIIVVLGVFDDIYDLKAIYKLIVQIIAAGAVVLSGTKIEFLSVPRFISPEGIISLGVSSVPITIIWIVGITNAVNLIDGLDGLAVGVSSISSLSLLCIALLVAEPDIALLAAALAGACFGFLPYNLNPAKIFMGDTGATFLGFVLATISVQGLFKAYAVISFAVPLLILGLPIFDTGFAIVRRLANGKPIMTADRGHLHHRLIDMGFTQRQTVSILYVLCTILCLSAVVLIGSGPLRAAVLVIAALVVLAFTLKSSKQPPNGSASGGSDKPDGGTEGGGKTE